MYRMALKNAKRVIFENKVNAGEFVKRHIIQEKRETVLKGAGVNLDFYKYQPYLSEENGIHFLFLGRIMKEKGVEELFEAARELKKKYGKKIMFDLVGFFEDEYKETVEDLIRTEVITFYGFQSDPKPYYEMSHCVVLPSYHEGMSNVLLEAASTGRALITTDIPGCREAVDDGISGYLCKKMDVGSLFNCIERFMELNSAERREMGIRGREKMKSEFDRNKVVKKTMEVINID